MGKGHKKVKADESPSASFSVQNQTNEPHLDAEVLALAMAARRQTYPVQPPRPQLQPPLYSHNHQNLDQQLQQQQPLQQIPESHKSENQNALVTHPAKATRFSLSLSSVTAGPGLCNSSTAQKPWTIDLDEPEPGVGPENGAYAYYSVLDPLMSVELLDGEYRISVRFNLQTGVIHQDGGGLGGFRKGSKSIRFLDFVELRYKSRFRWESVEGQPGPDPEQSFVVTNTAGKSVSTDLGGTGGSPLLSSGTIRVGIVKNNNMSVEETVKSWALSSNRVLGYDGGQTISNPSFMKRLKCFFMSNRPPEPTLVPPVPHGWRWHWQGRQFETNKLNLDQTDCVTRHVVLTRVVPIAKLTNIFRYSDELTKGEKRRLAELLKFDFQIAIGVKQVSKNFYHPIKRPKYNRDRSAGVMLEPLFSGRFSLDARNTVNDLQSWPKGNTGSIDVLLKEAVRNVPHLDGLRRLKLHDVEHAWISGGW